MQEMTCIITKFMLEYFPYIFDLIVSRETGLSLRWFGVVNICGLGWFICGLGLTWQVDLI